MSNKQKLIDYIVTNGRDGKTWDELAKMFNLTSGETARHTYRNYKRDQEKTATTTTQQIVREQVMDMLKNAAVDSSGTAIGEMRTSGYHHVLPDPSTAGSVFHTPEITTYPWPFPNWEPFPGPALPPFLGRPDTPPSTTSDKIKISGEDNCMSLDDLLKTANVDTDKWEVDRFKQRCLNGKWEIEAHLKPTEKSSSTNLKEEILSMIKEHTPHTGKVTTTEEQGTLQAVDMYRGNLLLELALFDLHIGKLSWDKETGEDYDIEIACKRYSDAVEELLGRLGTDDIGRIVLPIGNDMINVDGKTNMTTGGTPQSCDSRFGKMFQTAKDLIIKTVERLLEIAPVDVVVVPGNHDELTMFTLGEVVDAWFHRDADVTVYNSPKLRKYYEFGANMLMFTHGNQEKHTELGLIAAHEEPEMWARTKFREVHLGHLHKSKTVSHMTVDEFQGFKVRIIPSLSGTDAWHYSKGYSSQKAAKAFVWDRDKGLVAELTYTVV